MTHGKGFGAEVSIKKKVKLTIMVKEPLCEINRTVCEDECNDFKKVVKD